MTSEFRNPTQAILSALRRDQGGLVLFWYPDDQARLELIGQVEALTGESITETESVEEALAARDRLVFLRSNREQELVLELDGNRDRFLEPKRARPVVLLLQRDGPGRDALTKDAPSLRSWIAGSDPDPELIATIDVDAARSSFSKQFGASPESWLERWRAGKIAATLDNFGALHRASLLELAK
ncbi:MAG: hypothetical protein HY791_14465 [Deltaproteobacteria bacterium]|nr:hypothetical protein [Deltaproteobacteria bacterium]